MSTGSLRLLERKKMKALKVLELFDQGYSYRKIAKLVHLSLRDVSKFINLAADKTRTPSTASIHDLIILEYRVSNYRHELNDLRLEKENLKNEVNVLRAQKSDLQNQSKRSKLEAVKRDLEYERFSKEILENIFTE
jgi:predicted transcriptional regulator